MTVSIAGYFKEELTDWKDNIRFNLGDAAKFESRLMEIIQRDGIPGIAGNAERLLNWLETLQETLITLRHEIIVQENAILFNGEPVNNSRVTTDIVTKQNTLRKDMMATERELVDLKFDCYNFLAGMVKN